MHPPHGPLKIGANRQITLPAELLRQVTLEPGDSVYVAVADDVEGALVIVPVERLVAWLEAGRARLAATETEAPSSEGRPSE